MRATVINNIICDNTTYLAMKKEYQKLWESKELQPIIKGTINIIISKIISFKYVERCEVESALYIYFCKQVDDYKPIYNGGLITFRAYIITKLQVLQRYPSALGYNIVDYGKKFEEIPSSCVKLASEQENDIDSIANLLTDDGQEDKYELEDNKKTILELIAKNDFLNEKEKDVLKNYVIYDIERQIDYKRKFEVNAAQCFFDMRNRLAKNPHALDQLLDYLYNYDYTRKNKKIEEIVSDKGTNTRQYRKRLLCIKPDGTKVTYNSMLTASKELGMSYNAVRNLANTDATDSKSGITFQLIN